MIRKKIIYLKQEVKIGDVIDCNGIKVTVTDDLIENNPTLFEVSDDISSYLEFLVKKYMNFYDADLA
jgi:hypothetical protein